jgi:iron(III) transport system permease protein
VPEIDLKEQTDARTNGRSAEPSTVSPGRSWWLWDGVREWYLWGPAGIVAIGVLIPLGYLVLRALAAEPAQLADLVFRARTLELLWNTVSLTAGVLVVSTSIAFPLAWLTARTDLRGKRLVTLLSVLPLAVPGYVMAYVLLATTGSYGTLAQIAGLVVPRLNGYTGALIALSLYTFPYLFLNLRTALMDLDPALEESARALGYRRTKVLRHVILPQLRPGFLSGGLLVGLHVLGDFGVVSLMRFKTFSYAIYLQYAASYDRTYAACLALMLLVLTAAVLFLEARLLRGLLLHRTGSGTSRQAPPVKLGAWRIPSYLFVGTVAMASVGVPVLTVGYWMLEGTAIPWAGLGDALWGSVSASAPAALLAGALALPLAYLSVRRPSRGTKTLERIAYFGYATPPLAFALALIFFTLRTVPPLYQTLGLLIIAYALHFLAEAIGPIRTALYQAPPRLEEAARSLGRTPLQAFFAATFPLLRKGLLVSVALVFLSAMKELPLTFLLSPIGFDALALKVWSYANEALFAGAAPFALAIMAVSAAFVGLLLLREKR